MSVDNNIECVVPCMSVQERRMSSKSRLGCVENELISCILTDSGNKECNQDWMKELKSWVDVSFESHFPIQNLPYGVFSTENDPNPRIGVAIGDYILDLREISRAGLFDGHHLRDQACFEQSTLNDFMSLGRPAWQEARAKLQHLLDATTPSLRDDSLLRHRSLIPQSRSTMYLPATIGDYTDFYCSKEHAINCGVIFRGPDNPLNPNWLHLPVAYHGRSSSIVISGTNVRRPWGQILVDSVPTFQPSRAIDFELELGCLIGPGNSHGTPIPLEKAIDYMFGFVMVNDWSARDIQRWENVPLGPFNAKNWATSISPWVVTLEALEPFKAPAPPQNPTPLPYLSPPRSCDPRSSINYNYDIRLDVSINTHHITSSNMRTLYWTVQQMIAHHTVGGCNLRTGDLIATGTLSVDGGSGREQGCLLELTENGRKGVRLGFREGEGEEERTYLHDGDTVRFSGYCQGEGFRIGFGECTGTLLPAWETLPLY